MKATVTACHPDKIPQTRNNSQAELACIPRHLSFWPQLWHSSRQRPWRAPLGRIVALLTMQPLKSAAAASSGTLLHTAMVLTVTSYRDFRTASRMIRVYSGIATFLATCRAGTGVTIPKAMYSQSPHQ
ncbi:hypothetical protein CRV24_008748 [Beauveria bassiana]|nr:hypothetical protein CRV24_008748 [Beauveria bassiana]